MKKFSCYLALTITLLLSVMLFHPLAHADYLNPFTYQDKVTFDPSYLNTAVADWWQHIPSTFAPESATVTLELRVSQYSDIGVLDLFASNTNNFDVGDPYTAYTKPGFIARLYTLVPPIFVNPNLQTVTLSLKLNQVDWLADDGNIHLALIGNQYLFPLGYPAKFYLTSATLTASAVPLPGAIWLTGPGLLGLLGVKRFFKG